MSDPLVIGSGPGSALQLVPMLESGEVARAAYYASRCKVQSWEGSSVSVLLTDRRILFSKDRLFGGPRIDRSLKLADIVKSSYGAMYGVGPAWLLHLTDSQSWLSVIQFSAGDECEAFARLLS